MDVPQHHGSPLHRILAASLDGISPGIASGFTRPGAPLCWLPAVLAPRCRRAVVRRYGGLVTEHAQPADDEQEPVRRDDLVMYAWRHSSGQVRTSPEEFLAVSGLSDREQQLLRGRYRWDDSEA